MSRPERRTVSPLVGPRPAGRPDECFYCHSKMGELYKDTCVMNVKRVLVTYSVTVPINVPADWEPADIDFRLNESSHCLSNDVDRLIRVYNRLSRAGWCPCGIVTAKYVKDAAEE